MERNSSQAGKLLLGASYEFEYLQDVGNGTQPISNPSNERTTSEISALFLNYSITDKFSIETVLPWRKIVNSKISIVEGSEGIYIRKTEGFSDAILLFKYSDYFFDDQILATFASGLKLATGSVTDLDEDDNVISETLQVGSGTVDPLFSLFLGYPSGRWLYSGSLFSRISVYENVRGYRYGNEFHGRISVNYDKSDALFIKGGLETVVTKRDTHQYGEPESQRGGEWAYLVSGFGIRFSNNFILDVEYPWTIYYSVNESQLVPDGFLRLNLFYDWAL
ncbi:MAG: hypothetical protein HN820_05790 [Candidatus Marinimicrobia bacterium]|jgi:hypothetical protein|nr:hypothetical protein [Candidatus Neomarinimicrobiota bacterium]MBT5956854.1 hypothetical protein [Candidatus Neomarinimicrobiota bacterium]MBT6869915.1 hypothetical protein [Candidatus Neomarinimicrobiota bacterium]MBT7377648.1 hypothetical protein [Candidatus Neomarinimicrobiota bacterium]